MITEYFYICICKRKYFNDLHHQLKLKNLSFLVL